MCAIKQSCDSPSCPSYSTRQSDRIKLPSSHHSGPSYGYYPQPYPRYIQYEPYGVHHHPIPSYPSSCYNNHENLDEVFPESKDKLSRQTWYLIIILIVIIFALGYALYRTLSRTGQRFRSVRQANIVPSTQVKSLVSLICINTLHYSYLSCSVFVKLDIVKRFSNI